MIMEGEFSEPLDPLKLVEALHELALRDPHRRIPILMPIHPLFMHQHHHLTCVALHKPPNTLPLTSMALTLLSVVYPYQYGWNYHIQYPISPTILIPPTPTTRYPSLTKSHYYQLDDSIVIHKGKSQLIYKDKSYIPTHLSSQSEDLKDYPFGWTLAIEGYCLENEHHPNCQDPI